MPVKIFLILFVFAVLDDINNKDLHAKIKEEVKALAHKFIIYDKAMF